MKGTATEKGKQMQKSSNQTIGQYLQKKNYNQIDIPYINFFISIKRNAIENVSIMQRMAKIEKANAVQREKKHITSTHIYKIYKYMFKRVSRRHLYITSGCCCACVACH